MRPGVLIAIEGIDGAGKTTQIERLVPLLTGLGFEVVRTKEPTTGPHGQRIRASARTGRMTVEEELALFLLDREEHVRDLIVPSLDAGRIVLVDRYYPSTIAYQGARGLDVDELRARNERIAPAPDLLVVLDLDVRQGLARVAGRGDVADLFEEEGLLTASRAIFAGMRWPQALILDARQPVEQVTALITRALWRGPLRARMGADAHAALSALHGDGADGVIFAGERTGLAGG